MPIIQLENLVKEFNQPDGGKLKAVDGISFDVAKGEIFGMLGPNGAGKTTTLEIIEGLQSPTSGTTKVMGFDSTKDTSKVKEHIGIQLQTSSFFDHLSLIEILNLFGSFYPKHTPPEELLEIVDLTDKSKSQVAHLSGGQQQRFSIVVGLVNDPDIVFLDEPTTGLDPQARRHMWKFIRRINEQGRTIVLTTHYMEEAEELCDRVAIVDQGKIVALDSPEILVDKLDASAHLSFRLEKELVQPDVFSQIEGITDSEKNGEGVYRLKIAHASVALPPLIQWAMQNDNRLRGIEIKRATLEDVFIDLTGSKLRE
ncbi:ABC transporter ATP-binding protein [Patescibacteria group bacterium]|nr:ABC transporter ATP-binding protein [Patescibacteria group bacterium]MBU1890030.1 ABC transporter ATP-binding protein [Patescibacteria group bacterium]